MVLSMRISKRDDALSIETIRRVARVLVIDDHTFPYQRFFTRDGYHFERWPDVRNLSQVTDGHYQLVLLDIQGVGLRESPTRQGLGVLEHIKATNPAQPVIIYSAERQYLSSNKTLALADDILDKRAEYVEYKEAVDRVLQLAFRPDYYLSALAGTVGEPAANPRFARLARRALQGRDRGGLARYLERTVTTKDQVEVALQVIQVGLGVLALVNP